MHLKRNHPAQWSSYEEKKNKKNKETASTKKEEKESCDMENAEIRLFDIRSHGGRQPFLNKVFCPFNQTLQSLAVLPGLNAVFPHCPLTHTVL